MQPGSYDGKSNVIFKKSLKTFSNLSVTHAKMSLTHKIICNTFFLYIQVVNNMFLLFPTAVVVFIDNPYNFQDFLSFLKFI